MIIMPANNTGYKVCDLAERFPSRIAHLISPEGWRTPFLPYALDNGAFSAFIRKTPFDAAAYLNFLSLTHQCIARPMWALVPDTVGCRDSTLAMWRTWSPALLRRGLTLAFAAQDGMSFSDVPKAASVVFIGGSTPWKLGAIKPWCGTFPRVHVGRVNTPDRLWLCHDAGAESVDGTGFFRGNNYQETGLVQYLAATSGLRARESCDGGGKMPDDTDERLFWVAEKLDGRQADGIIRMNIKSARFVADLLDRRRKDKNLRLSVAQREWLTNLEEEWL